MADEDFTPEELELLDEMIADLKAINQSMIDMIERDKNGAARFNQLMAQIAPSTPPLNSKTKSISNIASAGEKNSCTELVLIDLTPLKPSPSEAESTMVMEQKEDQLEDPVVESLDLVHSKREVQVIETLNNGGVVVAMGKQLLQPFVPINQQTKCTSSNFLPGVFISNRLLDLYTKCGSLVDAQEVFDEMDNRDLCPHWIIMTGLDSIEPLLAQTNEYQLMMLTPVAPRLPPKPPDVSYCTVGFSESSHYRFKMNHSVIPIYRPLLQSVFSQPGEIYLEHYQWLPNIIKQNSMIIERPGFSVKFIENIMLYLFAGPSFRDYWFSTLCNVVISPTIPHDLWHRIVATDPHNVCWQFYNFWYSYDWQIWDGMKFHFSKLFLSICQNNNMVFIRVLQISITLFASKIDIFGIETQNVKQLINAYYEENLKEQLYQSEIAKRLEEQHNTSDIDWKSAFLIWHRPTSNINDIPNLSEELCQIMDKYIAQLIQLAEELSQLIGENLGLDKNHIKEAFSGHNNGPAVGTKVAKYRQCPHPELVRGLREHTDADGIILLLQDDQVSGLEFFKDGKWVEIPLTKNNAIFMNIGDQIEVLSNGLYNSIILDYQSLLQSLFSQSGGMTYIKQEFSLETDPTLEGLIVSMSFLTGTVVTIFSGTVADLIGRRPLLIASSIMFFLRGLVIMWAPSVTIVLVSRVLDGVAIALAITLNPLYISEIAPPDIRGQLTTLTQFDCSGGMFLALLAEGLNPGGEDISVEEYIVPLASEILVNEEARKDYIKLYGPNEGVLIVAQPVNGQGSMVSCCMLSQQGSFASQAAAGLKNPIVNLFEILHESSLHDNRGSRSMLIHNASSIFSVGDPDPNTPFGTSDNLQAPFLSFQGGAAAKDKAYGSKYMLGFRSNSGLRSNRSLVHGNVAETPKNSNIGGGWQLVYNTAEGGGKREGALQRVYLHADSAAVSQVHQASFVSTSDYDIPVDGGEAYQAAILVSQSVLGTHDTLNMPEAVGKGPNWRGLLEPGVKRALIVGIGLQYSSMCCSWILVLNLVGLNMESTQPKIYGVVQFDNVKGFHQDMKKLNGLQLDDALEEAENLHSVPIISMDRLNLSDANARYIIVLIHYQFKVEEW